MNQLPIVEPPRRRVYSEEFKVVVLEQCCQPGASLAGVALGYGINPNMVHRWMREGRQRLELLELQRGLRHLFHCNSLRFRAYAQT